MKVNTLYLLLFLLFPCTLSAQKTERVCGEYTYYAPSDKSPEEAKLIALERAKIEALADKFGTTVTQNNFTNVKNSNGNSSVDFQSIGGSEVKGEWLETVGETDFRISFEQNQMVVKVSVCGKARAVTRAMVEFNALLLRNGTEDKFKSEEFYHGDDLFLSFRSPVDGYLTIYLMDNQQRIYCLLPYRQSSFGAVRIKHGQRFVFFSKTLSDSPEVVDEYTLTAEKDMEYNRLYVIFSPQPFAKANDEILDEALPRELSFANFQKWLNKGRNRDKAMQVETIDITIKK